MWRFEQIDPDPYLNTRKITILLPTTKELGLEPPEQFSRPGMVPISSVYYWLEGSLELGQQWHSNVVDYHNDKNLSHMHWCLYILQEHFLVINTFRRRPTNENIWRPYPMKLFSKVAWSPVDHLEKTNYCVNMIDLAVISWNITHWYSRASFSFGLSRKVL